MSHEAYSQMRKEEYDAKRGSKTEDVQRNYFDVWRSKSPATSPNPLDTDKVTQQEWEQFTNPEHYRTNGIECIEYQRATSTPEEFQGYLKNCCVKYLHRMRTKDDPLKNLLKAQWYLNRLVEEFKKQS